MCPANSPPGCTSSSALKELPVSRSRTSTAVAPGMNTRGRCVPAGGMRAEDRKRIPMAALDQGLDCGIVNTGEEDRRVRASFMFSIVTGSMRRCAMLDRPRSGIVSHFGRLAASYWISYAAFSSRNRSSSRSRLSSESPSCGRLGSNLPIGCPGRPSGLRHGSRSSSDVPDLAELLGRHILVGHRRRDGHIVEGAQQTGDVAERACLGAPFLQLAQRFALEVDDVGIALCDENLSEMEVAMDPRQQRARGPLRASRSTAAMSSSRCASSSSASPRGLRIQIVPASPLGYRGRRRV